MPKSTFNVRSPQKEIKIKAFWVKQVLGQVVSHEKITGEFTILFVDDRTITILNAKYRKKNKPTDVLAFSYTDSEATHDYAGDIVISIPTAVRQAKSLRHSLQKEVAFLMVHGVLHLLGYEHKTSSGRKKMFSRQEMHLKNMKELLTSNEATV